MRPVRVGLESPAIASAGDAMTATKAQITLVVVIATSFLFAGRYGSVPGSHDVDDYRGRESTTRPPRRATRCVLSPRRFGGRPCVGAERAHALAGSRHRDAGSRRAESTCRIAGAAAASPSGEGGG